MKNKYARQLKKHRNKRFFQPGFWIGILTLAVLTGILTNPWSPGKSILHAAVPGLKLETSDGFYEIEKSKGRVVVLFFSFTG